MRASGVSRARSATCASNPCRRRRGRCGSGRRVLAAVLRGTPRRATGARTVRAARTSRRPGTPTPGTTVPTWSRGVATAGRTRTIRTRPTLARRRPDESHSAGDPDRPPGRRVAALPLQHGLGLLPERGDRAHPADSPDPRPARKGLGRVGPRPPDAADAGRAARSLSPSDDALAGLVPLPDVRDGAHGGGELRRGAHRTRPPAGAPGLALPWPVPGRVQRHERRPARRGRLPSRPDSPPARPGLAGADDLRSAADARARRLGG